MHSGPQGKSDLCVFGTNWKRDQCHCQAIITCDVLVAVEVGFCVVCVVLRYSICVEKCLCFEPLFMATYCFLITVHKLSQLWIELF